MNMPLPTDPPTTVALRTASMPTTPKKIQLSGIQGCGGCHIPTTPETPSDIIMDKMRTGFGPNTISDEKGPEYAMPKNPFIKNGADSILTPPKPTDNFAPTFPGNSPENFKQPPIEGTSEFGKPKPIMNEDGSIAAIEPTSGLLYEFNHTQTFQGHKEKGYLDNSKEGNYFVNQRDGIKQVVEYIANESGYQPYIRFVNLTASETPDPQTEKIRNMLHTMYFKWFYGKG